MKLLGAIILLLFVLTFPALTQEKDLPPAQAELVNTERAFAKLAVERGVRESFIAYFADDGMGLAPHPHMVKETFSKSPAPATRSPIVLNWAPVYGDIAQAGDLGWNTGPTVFEDTSPEKKPARHGMFFSVWKKQSDGSWRVALDLGANTPAAVAPLNAPFKTSYRASSKRPAAGVNVEGEIAGLLKVEREFLAAAKASSLGQAYQSRLSDDARVHRPGVMPVVGKSALRGWLAQQTMTLSGEPIKADVSRSGDLGYAYGSYELGGAKPEKGYYARVWKRDAVTPRNYAFINGLWFDGQKFTTRNFYSVSGVLSARKPARVDRIIDLTGKYVIPPFGEAHNHNVESSRIDAVIKMYLEAGIFYVKNPNSLPRFTTPLLSKINIPTSIDVIFANGGLTGSGGHPMGIARRNIERKIWTEADADGGFVFIIDNQADLDRKWERIKAGKPDFIKTYLLYSEEYAKRKDAAAYVNWRGLDPTLLAEIVRRAHRDGLRVSTHIESAADFHQAVVAGVDEINHLPGFRPDRGNLQSYENLSRYEIAEEDAQLAARKGIFVVTTLGSTIETLNRMDPNSPMGSAARKLKDLFVRNLHLLSKHNVRIAIGSDEYRRDSAYEALNLHTLKALDNLTLLKTWCENTAATIFPQRKIGHLKDRYEASFLVLSGDPLADFTNVQKIEMRIKQGEILDLAARPSGPAKP